MMELGQHEQGLYGMTAKDDDSGSRSLKKTACDVTRGVSMKPTGKT